jgi:hypothetical protein
MHIYVKSINGEVHLQTYSYNKGKMHGVKLYCGKCEQIYLLASNYKRKNSSTISISYYVKRYIARDNIRIVQCAR